MSTSALTPIASHTSAVPPFDDPTDLFLFPFGWIAEQSVFTMGETWLFVIAALLYAAGFLISVAQMDGVDRISAWVTPMLTWFPATPPLLALLIEPWRIWLLWLAVAYFAAWWVGFLILTHSNERARAHDGSTR